MFFEYIRSVPQFAPTGPFGFGSLTLRRYTASEARTLQAALSKRNVFVRHAPEGDHYTKRARMLADAPVLHTNGSLRLYDKTAIRWEADAVETLLVLATSFGMKRAELHKYIAGHHLRVSTTDLWIDASTGHLSTRTVDRHPAQPLPVDERLTRRYQRLGLDGAQKRASEDTFVGARIRLVGEWLLSSRIDPNVGSALIKTGTAAETLIAGNSTGQVTKKISDRVAKLIAEDQQQLGALRDLLRELYGARCDFAHGRHFGTASKSQKMQLEVFDRLVTLGMASFSANCGNLSDPAAIDQWFNNANIPLNNRPFSPFFVRRALLMV